MSTIERFHCTNMIVFELASIALKSHKRREDYKPSQLHLKRPLSSKPDLPHTRLETWPSPHSPRNPAFPTLASKSDSPGLGSKLNDTATRPRPFKMDYCRLTVILESLSVLHERREVLLVLPHVLHHGPPQRAVVATAVAELVSEGSKETVTGREENPFEQGNQLQCTLY